MHRKKRKAYGATRERVLRRLEVLDRQPALADETLVGHVQVEQVERVVDGFDLAHFDEPHDQIARCILQRAPPVLFRLLQHLPVHRIIAS